MRIFREPPPPPPSNPSPTPTALDEKSNYIDLLSQPCTSEGEDENHCRESSEISPPSLPPPTSLLPSFPSSLLPSSFSSLGETKEGRPFLSRPNPYSTGNIKHSIIYIFIYIFIYKYIKKKKKKSNGYDRIINDRLNRGGGLKWTEHFNRFNPSPVVVVVVVVVIGFVVCLIFLTFCRVAMFFASSAGPQGRGGGGKWRR